MRKLRIVLAIDGGGIRGLLPLRILEFLDSRFKDKCQSPLFNYVDLVAGSSTGAIISAALIMENEKGNAQFTPTDIISLYRQRGEQIFSKDRLENKSPLKLVLDSSFGNATIQDLNKQFLFVCFDEKLKEGFVFQNEMKQYRNVPLADILLASSSIKPYFEPVEIGNKLLSDGMYAAKNPAEIAYNYAVNYFPDDAILLLSLGTGKLSNENFDEVERLVEYVEESLQSNARTNRNLVYYRLNPQVVSANDAMDDTSNDNIEALIKDSDAFIAQHKHLLEEIVNQCCLAAD